MAVDPAVGAEHLRRLLEAEGPGLGLGAGIRIGTVWNPGGFVNASFSVTDGRTRLHVKLTAEPGKADRWFRLSRRLARDYRAPPILARFALPAAGLAAIVSPWLPGRAPDPARSGKLLGEIAELLGRLHADAELARELADGPAPTLLSSFETGLLECLEEDLAAVLADPAEAARIPPQTRDWLRAEAAALREEGRRRIPDELATSAIHGDPWLQNVLADGPDWHLLDWESVRLGDPAGDWAMLTFDPWVHGADPDDFLPPDPGLRARVRFLLRAASFDSIVDPLSDLTEMPPGVADPEGVRAAKRAESDRALRRYRGP